MVQQDGSVWIKLGWGSLSNLKTFLFTFWVSYLNRKDSSIQKVMNELLNNWGDLILKLILPSCYLHHKILKVFCNFSIMTSQWFTCSRLRLFSSLEVWCQNSLQGNNCLLRMIQNQMTAFLKLILLIKTFIKKLPWLMSKQKQEFSFLVILLGMSMKKSFERNVWSSIKLLLNTFWRIYHMITRQSSMPNTCIQRKEAKVSQPAGFQILLWLLLRFVKFLSLFAL